MIPIVCLQNVKVMIDYITFFLNKLLLFILKACKYLTNELSESLLKHNSHDIIETGYSLDDRLNKKNPKKYRDS